MQNVWYLEVIMSTSLCCSWYLIRFQFTHMKDFKCKVFNIPLGGVYYIFFIIICFLKSFEKKGQTTIFGSTIAVLLLESSVHIKSNCFLMSPIENISLELVKTDTLTSRRSTIYNLVMLLFNKKTLSCKNKIKIKRQQIE